MECLKKIREHQFIKYLFEDSKLIAKDKNFKVSDIALPSDVNFEEWEYHIHNVGFYTVHLLYLCSQLYSAIEFLSNYSYQNQYMSFKDLLKLR
jgi:hypothetical protein